MYNQYQPSFGQAQQQQVQSQYRGFQKQFQPTGYVQSFYQQQQPSQQQSFQTQNYHASNYVGSRQDHDAYLREDSIRPSTYASTRAQGMGTLNNVQGTYNVNMPTSQMTGGFQGATNYHAANYVGNQQNHDASLREDSFRASTYAAGRTQGINSLNNVQGAFQTSMPTSQFTQQGQGFSPYRSF